jgi:3',5'-cyclic-AMP phosphodiesterase
MLLLSIMIVAQISDPHINLEKPESSLALQKTVQHLLNIPACPDVVIVTGDCVDEGSLAEYQQFKKLLAPLTMPVYVIPGNHDNRVHLQSTFGTQGDKALEGFVQYVVEHTSLRLIALDTNVPDKAAGMLCLRRLEWLEERLSESDRPTLLFMHHPPFTLGIKPFDDIGLQGTEAFAAVVSRHCHVERIVAGHVHSAISVRFHGTLAMTCPATANLSVPDVRQPQKLAVMVQSPICLLHVWSPSSGLLSYTSPTEPNAKVVTVHDGEKWL